MVARVSFPQYRKARVALTCDGFTTLPAVTGRENDLHNRLPLLPVLLSTVAT